MEWLKVIFVPKIYIFIFTGFKGQIVTTTKMIKNLQIYNFKIFNIPVLVYCLFIHIPTPYSHPKITIVNRYIQTCSYRIPLAIWGMVSDLKLISLKSSPFHNHSFSFSRSTREWLNISKPLNTNSLDLRGWSV